MSDDGIHEDSAVAVADIIRRIAKPPRSEQIRVIDTVRVWVDHGPAPATERPARPIPPRTPTSR